MKCTLYLGDVDGEENKGRSFFNHVFQEWPRLQFTASPIATTQAAFLLVQASNNPFHASKILIQMLMILSSFVKLHIQLYIDNKLGSISEKMMSFLCNCFLLCVFVHIP